MASENNKRIAKNTMFLYMRMLFSMGISLYASRVVLQTLGIEDFGIYGVVGGVVSMFTFLNSSMAGATSRFLTFELGKRDWFKLRDTFSSALLEHLAISVLIALIAETIGLWFLVNKLVIPEDRLMAAIIVYQFSILSMIFSVIQVPFSASIIAHERMNVYAYIEMFHAFLKLLIVYLLLFVDFDKLILYAVLLSVVSFIVLCLYSIFCIVKFKECRLRLVWKPSILKPMLCFSGWDVYGNMSVMARSQGVNMLLNIFFGPMMNAASSIATQVQGAVMAFSTNIITAFRPQIVKSYATGCYKNMDSLISMASRLNFMLLSVIMIPLIIEIDYILSLWLGNVPHYASIFCSFTLLFVLFSSMSTILIVGIHATGKIRRPSLINGSLYLMVVPLSYLAYLYSMPVWISYIFNVFAVIIGMLSNAYTLHKYVSDFSVLRFIKRDLSRCSLVFIIGALGGVIPTVFIDIGLIQLFVVFLMSFILISISGYLILIPVEIKNNLKTVIVKRVCEKD